MGSPILTTPKWAASATRNRTSEITQTTNVGALPEKLKLRIGVSYRACVSLWDENTAEPLTPSVRWRTDLQRTAAGFLLVWLIIAGWQLSACRLVSKGEQ